MFKVTKTSAKHQHCPPENFMKAADSDLSPTKNRCEFRTFIQESVNLRIFINM